MTFVAASLEVCFFSLTIAKAAASSYSAFSNSSAEIVANSVFSFFISSVHS
jgi:hypothetical protein